ncbi:hypothetical protein HAZT_HAZT008536 [Hyalella azteca]|uniref:Uncharacterized protein n=1 Tax=Hyalella azteca TaxID=294128 RepID=A0A6A0HCL7_HYAAZ|nr:hypothetical protein HAZT_HAZT008536 [Hyalella azteca]
MVSRVTVRSCVRLYSTAEEIGALRLRDHCSALISTHWDELTTADFAHMSAQLLYAMVKNKTQRPLHAAIRLHREDVVFLYLIEHRTQVEHCMLVVHYTQVEHRTQVEHSSDGMRARLAFCASTLHARLVFCAHLDDTACSMRSLRSLGRYCVLDALTVLTWTILRAHYTIRGGLFYIDLM